MHLIFPLKAAHALLQSSDTSLVLVSYCYYKLVSLLPPHAHFGDKCLGLLVYLYTASKYHFICSLEFSF